MPAALGPALIPLLSPFRSDPSAGVYDPEGTAPSRTTRFAKTPNYFSSFKDRSGDWAVYLGACIMGKVSSVLSSPEWSCCRFSFALSLAGWLSVPD
jgi:hypothetical protein